MSETYAQHCGSVKSLATGRIVGLGLLRWVRSGAILYTSDRWLNFIERIFHVVVAVRYDSVACGYKSSVETISHIIYLSRLTNLVTLFS